MSSSSPLDLSFEAAKNFVAKNGSSGNYPQNVQLDLYALFKQATSGSMPDSEAEPSRIQFEKRAKWQARNKLKGMSAEEAKKRYCETLIQADSRFVDPAKALTKQEASPRPVTDAPPPPRLPPKPDAIVPSSPPSSSYYRPAPSPPPPTATTVVSQEGDAMFHFAVLGSLALVGLGLLGFLISTLSYTALACLGVAGMGLMALIGAVFAHFEEHGLLPYLSKGMVEMLLDTTLLEFLLDDTLLKELNHVIVQLLPAMLAEDEDTKLEALSHMSLALRRKLTMRGLVHSLPSTMTRVLLPRRLREQVTREEPKFRLQKHATDPVKFARLLKSDSTTTDDSVGRKLTDADSVNTDEGEMHDLTPSRRLAKELFATIVSKKNVELTLALIDPHRAKVASGTLAIFALMQLTVSTRSREILKTFLQTVALLGAILGSGFSAGLLFLWFVAKSRKRQKGW